MDNLEKLSSKSFGHALPYPIFCSLSSYCGHVALDRQTDRIDLKISRAPLRVVRQEGVESGWLEGCSSITGLDLSIYTRRKMKFSLDFSKL